MKFLPTLGFFLLLSFSVQYSKAQYLNKGFDLEEIEELIRINTTFSESKKNKALIPLPKYSKLQYVSPEMGLDNKWELWIKDNHIAVFGIRGSTKNTYSWLANFFAAQIPAIGSLKIEKDYIFSYKLAENPKASVHTGYVFSSAFLIRDMLPRIDSLYKAGVKDIIITGHSQGGGLAYIVASNFLWQQKDGLIPQDIRFKIYTTASPKPGNLYFAYDYERVALDGWAYHLVNTEDWVPQTPFTVQTIDDLPKVNPVPFAKAAIAKQSFLKKLFIKPIYNKLTKPSFEAVENYQAYLGEFVGEKIKKKYKDFEIPTFANSSEYVRAGRQIVLYPDSVYYKEYDPAKDPNNFMLNHSNNAYYYLLLNTKIN